MLTNPSSLSARAANTFSADAGASLLANTTYAVVFKVTSGTATTRLDRTDSDAEDPGAASGWSVANKRRSRQGIGSWTGETAPEKLLIAIKAKESLQTTARRRPAAVPDETPLPVAGSACRLDPIPPIDTCRWLSVLSRADPVPAQAPLAD